MATTAQVPPVAVSAADDEDARLAAIRHTMTVATMVLTTAIETVHVLDPAADPIALFNEILGDLGRHLPWCGCTERDAAAGRRGQ